LKARPTPIQQIITSTPINTTTTITISSNKFKVASSTTVAMFFSESQNQSRESLDRSMSLSTTYSLQKPTNTMPELKPSLFSRLWKVSSPEERERKEMKRQQRRLDFEEVKKVQSGMMGGPLGSALT
jgi:hypothetical protein